MKLRPYFFRMGLTCVILMGVGACFMSSLLLIFLSNPRLNLLILALTVGGCIYAFYQLFSLRKDAEVLDDLKQGRWSFSSVPQANFLEQVLSFSSEKKKDLDPHLAKGLAHSLGDRLENERVLPRYLIGLLVFLGLLGTFWGLSQTIISITHLIQSMPSDGTNSANFFELLKQSLQSPLAGMGTAFSSSLFGLGGSLIIGFLELQVGHAYNRFFNETDLYLTSCSYHNNKGASVGSAPLGYIQSLLTKNVESLEGFIQVIEKTEKNERQKNILLEKLINSVALASEQNKTHQGLMVKLAEGQVQLQNLLATIPQGLDEESRKCLQHIERALVQSLQSQREDREEVLKRLKEEMRLIARSIASLGESSRLAS